MKDYKYKDVTTHFMFSVFDKTTACGRSYKHLDLTANIDSSNCKSCKNAYKLNQLKEEVDGSTRDSLHG